MRERVGHGEVGRRIEDEGGRPWADEWDPGSPASWLPADDGWAARRAARRRVDRRRARGPRPVRPRRPVVTARPPEVARPTERSARPVRWWWAGPDGGRVLIRSSRPGGWRRDVRYRLRRAVAGLALVAASALAVVALGLLARAAAPAGSAEPAGAVAVQVAADGSVTTTAAPGETVWEVVDRVAPGLSGAGRAALAERIVADNGLTSVRPRSGQVLRVAAG